MSMRLWECIIFQPKATSPLYSVISCNDHSLVTFDHTKTPYSAVQSTSLAHVCKFLYVHGTLKINLRPGLFFNLSRNLLCLGMQIQSPSVGVAIKYLLCLYQTVSSIESSTLVGFQGSQAYSLFYLVVATLLNNVYLSY